MSQDLICDLFVSDQVVVPCSPLHGVHERKADEHSIRLLDSGARLVSSVLWVEVEFLGVFQGQACSHLDAHIKVGVKGLKMFFPTLVQDGGIWEQSATQVAKSER